MTSDTVWFRRAMAAVISSGWVSHSRVEPSTSASSSVTVPVGKSPLTPSSLQSTSGASAWIDLAHASQHAATTCRKTSAQTRRAALSRADFSQDSAAPSRVSAPAHADQCFRQQQYLYGVPTGVTEQTYHPDGSWQLCRDGLDGVLAAAGTSHPRLGRGLVFRRGRHRSHQPGP